MITVKKIILPISAFFIAITILAQSNTTIKNDTPKKKSSEIKKYNSNWLTIIDSVDLNRINRTIESVNETNKYLIEIQGFEKNYYTSENKSKSDPMQSNYGIYDTEIEERDKISKMVNSKKLPISSQEFLNYRRVKSIQCNMMRLGINEYSFMPCKFSYKDGKLFFQKTGGSQRRSGYLYQKDASSYVFLGGWSVNNDPQTTYDSSHRLAGILYKVAQNIMIMIFAGDYEYEIYYITR